MRVYSGDALEGKMLIAFVALIFRNKMYTQLNISMGSVGFVIYNGMWARGLGNAWVRTAYFEGKESGIKRSFGRYGWILFRIKKG